jgi:thiol-disulfide isomerase/thioredoxin
VTPTRAAAPSWPRRTCLAALGSVCLPGWLASPAARAATPGATQRDVREPWPRRTPTPALDALNLQGERVQLADFKGRAVLLNFWASWCEPCKVEMPGLQNLPGLFGEDQLAVLALNFKEPPRRVLQFVNSTGFTLPVLLDPLGDHARAWDVRVFPTTVLIDRQGRARHRLRGEVDWTSAAALAWVDQLLAS